jgi:parallel beta-helix repeat protein
VATPRITDLGADEIKTIERLRAPSVIVEQRGSAAVAIDAYGRIVAGPDTDHAAVLQTALNSLTSGRTWKERVVARGSFTLQRRVSIPSYTVLDLRAAKLTLASGANTNVLYLTGVSNVEIHLGEIDGNKAGQTTTADAVSLSTCTSVRIEGGRIYSASASGIGVVNSKDIVVHNVRLEESNLSVFTWTPDPSKSEKIVISKVKGYRSRIAVSDVNDALLEGCAVWGFDYGTDVIPIQVQNVQYARIIGNHVEGGKQGIAAFVGGFAEIVGNTVKGAWMIGGGWGIGIGANIRALIANNIVSGCEGSGLDLEVERGLVVDNLSYGNLNGIYVGNANGTQYGIVVKGNVLYGNSRHGISLQNTQYSVFAENIIENNAQYGINRMGTSDYNIYIGNILRNNGAPSNGLGVNDIVVNNIGL